MSYGMGQINPGKADDQDPIQIGTLVKSDPIMSAASSMASQIMLRMASVPRGNRLDEMMSILDAAESGLGRKARDKFLSLVAKYPPRKKDQAMFDALRLAIADVLVSRTLKLAPAGTSGLGQTLAEARGQTSQGVNDANALFCSYGAGAMAMVGGLLTQFNAGGSRSTATTSGASTGANIAGCNAGSLLLQNQNSVEMARISQAGTAQALAAQAAAQAAADARTTRLAMIGGGILVVAVAGIALLRK